jgi:uncharacterized protein (DUF1697 family)
MTAMVALLRAVNVGGTGKLPMAELSAMCIGLGFDAVRTYIASGNVVFHTPRTEAQVKALLEARLQEFAGKKVGVMVRNAAELADIVLQNPFPTAPGNRVSVIFLDGATSAATLIGMAGAAGEQVQLGRREIYIHYPDGMAVTKLRIPAAKDGTARNANTVARLAAMAAE